MLDIRLFREHPDLMRVKLESRGVLASKVDMVLELDQKRRSILAQVEDLKARRNTVSREIPMLAKIKEPIDQLKAESKTIGETIAELDEQLRKVDQFLSDLLLQIPNIPHDSTPVGADEGGNKIVRTWGEMPKLEFEAKLHDALGENLGLLDMPRGAKLSGSGFYTLSGDLAKLERCLIQWMLDKHTEENGYTELSVPYLVNRKAMTGTGQLPKFEEDAYRINEDDLFLIPTAEVPVTNMHADEIFNPEDLPKAYCAHTPCFRREAGSAGRENRGVSRIHQFHKVELVHFTRPEDSAATHEKLVGHASGLLEELGLVYRVVELCTGDIGFSACKCYDLEIYAPGMDTWLEVSSCSNFWDFQSRRAGIRYRPEKGAKPQFVHTLNGSGLALPRLMIVLMETYQQPDGSIIIPEALRSRMGKDVIRKCEG